MWGHGGNYQTWADHLARWSRGEQTDGRALPALTRGDYHQDTWVRLTDQLTRALGTRMQGWADDLTRALNAEQDEFAAARALVQARSGLHAVRALAGHPRSRPSCAPGCSSSSTARSPTSSGSWRPSSTASRAPAPTRAGSRADVAPCATTR